MFTKRNEKFSLRKLTIGLTSVLIGVCFMQMQNDTVKADTVDNTSAQVENINITGETENSATGLNKNVNAVSSDAENSASQTVKQTDSNKQQANLAEKMGVNAEPTKAPALNDKTQSQASAQVKKATAQLANDAEIQPVTPHADSSTDSASTDWGTLNVNDWDGSDNNGEYELTGYHGSDMTHIIVPNQADFEKAGKNVGQVTISSLVAHNLGDSTTTSIKFSNTDGKKVKASDTIWTDTFSTSKPSVSIDRHSSMDLSWLSSFKGNLTQFDGSGLDVSGVTDMAAMFATNQLSDLRSLADWDVSNVKDMTHMFVGNQISDLSPLSNWKTNNVTTMLGMFDSNQKISDLSPLSSWNVGNVTDMSQMFNDNKISDLSPLANWKTNNVTNMQEMFSNNPISYADFTKWNFDKVQNLSWFIISNKNAVILTKDTDQAKLSKNIRTQQNQLHFDNDTVDMPTVYVATDKANAREKILNDINDRITSYKETHKGYGVEPVTELNQIQNLAALANASFVTVDSSSTITFTDTTDADKTVPDKMTVSGKGKISFTVPTGYEVNGDLPDMYYGTNYTIDLKHKTITVNPNNPVSDGAKTSTGKTINGAHSSDLNQTITRTIVVTKPNGTKQTVTQPAKLTRTASYDDVTGEVTYGDWSTGTWDEYKPSAIEGYTAGTVPEVVVKDGQKDETVNVGYTATGAAKLSGTNHSTYNGNPLTIGDLNSAVDNNSLTVKVTGPTAGSYTLKNGDVEFSSDGQTWTTTMPTDVGTYQIRLTSQAEKNIIAQFGNNSIKWVDADGNSTISGTATYIINPKKLTTVTISGEDQSKPYDDQPASLVTNDLAFSDSGTALTATDISDDDFDWYAADGNKLTAIPTDAGEYEVRLNNAGLKKLQTINPNYSFDKVNGSIKYTINKASVTVELTGSQTTSDLNLITNNYQVSVLNDEYVLFMPPTINDSSFSILVDGKKSSVNQLTKAGTYDVVFSDDAINAMNNDNKNYNITFNVTAKFTLENSKQIINYVDSDSNVIGTQILGGAIKDQFVDFTPDLPAGWTASETIPSKIQLENGTTKITIKHNVITVNPDKPVPDSGKTSTGKTIDGAHSNDLNKTITRTIIVNKPDGSKQTVTQPAKLTRSASYDDVTGEVTYGNWSTGKWDAYTPASVAGYTSETVPETQVTSAQTDTTVNITYSANDGQQTINYVDGNGTVIGNQIVKGKTDQNVSFTFDLPKGWVIDDSKNKPASQVIIPAVDTPITVNIKHGEITIDKPVKDGDTIPGTDLVADGISDSDLTHTVSRTINVTMPDNTKSNITQTASFNRSAVVDTVTGKVISYTDWKSDNNTFAEFIPEIVKGYTPSVESVKSKVVTADTPAETVNITYSANTQTGNIVYRDENGDEIGSQTITGKTGDIINLNLNVPDGYHLDPDKDVPKTVTVTADGIPEVDITVVKNQSQTGDPTTSDKDVLNIVKYTDNKGNVVGTENITGKDGDIVKINVPDGYHTDNGESTVTIDSKNPVQTITVTENKSQTGDDLTSDKDVLNIVKYTDNNGNVIDTQNITGKDSDIVKINVPDGYHTDNGESAITIDSKTPVQSITVTENKSQTGDNLIRDKDVLNIIKYTDNDGNVIGTEKITGKDGDTAEFNVPDGYHTDNGESAITIDSKTPVQTINVTKNRSQTGDPTTGDKDVLNIIKYTDNDGNVIGTEEVTGKDGDTADINVPDGYHTDNGESTVTIDSKNPVQTIPVVKNRSQTGDDSTSEKDVTNVIKFIDGDGNVIGTQTVTGKEGDTVTVEIPDGYHSETHTITIDSKNPVQTVLVVANNSNVDSGSGDSSTTVDNHSDDSNMQVSNDEGISSDDKHVNESNDNANNGVRMSMSKVNKSVNDNDADDVNVHDQTKARLPQTGAERANSISTIMGLLSIGLSGLIALAYRGKRKKQK